MRKIRSLNGIWERRVTEGKYEPCKVPYCDWPVGFCDCKRKFSIEKNGNERVFLCFDGITYEAEAFINGCSLGRMLPYVPYRFEITDTIIEGINELSVRIKDITAAYGPAEGWENYGGIIRDVYLMYTGETMIEDCFWYTKLSNEYTTAECGLDIKINGSDAEKLIVCLQSQDGDTVYTGEWKINETIRFDMEHPRLWSPDEPVLYHLSAAVVKNGEISDSIEKNVGFKELKTSGKRFLLNGKPLFLMGVCRHDMWGDAGHILTKEQMEQDMRMIKDTGANFVRLVHYPHHPYIIELADRLGLMISEEPGLWWSDMKNPVIVESSLEVMRRAVLRDRSHVSVAFWLSFNECFFTPEYLRAAAELCRQYDPTHLISGANCMDIPMTKKYFAECGLDFYTMHPYSPTVDRIYECANELTDKPLLLTEWGGYHVFNNPDLFGRFIDAMRELWMNSEEKPVVAGAFLWCWAEVFEHNRAYPACHGGVLCEALVDRFRKPLLNYKVFCDKCRSFNLPDQTKRTVEIIAAPKIKNSFRQVKMEVNARIQEAAWNDMMKLSAEPIKRFVFNERKLRVMKYGPVLPRDICLCEHFSLLCKPMVVTQPACGSITVSLEGTAEKMLLAGNVSMPKGYPIDGEYGEVAGYCTIRYNDGGQQRFLLRNGMEISTAAGWFGPSRIRPSISKGACILSYINDMDRERYVVHLLELPLDSTKVLKSVEIQALDGWALLYYGMGLE